MAIPARGALLTRRIPGRSRPLFHIVRSVWPAAALSAILHLSGSAEAQEGIRLETLATTSGGPLNTMGAVTGVAMSNTGLAIVLDGQNGRLLVFDEKLKHLSSFGRRGAGPGEFREAVAIAVLRDGRVAVLDRALRRITLLSVRDGGRTLAYGRSVSIGHAAEGMCTLGDDRVVVYGLGSDARLHVYDPGLTHLVSTGPLPAGYSPMAMSVLTVGTLFCEDDGEHVLVAGRLLPILERFRISSGQRVGVDTLRRLIRPIEVSDQGGKVSIGSGRGGFSRITTVFVHGRHRVVQTEFESRLDFPEVDTVATHLYSLDGGRWIEPQVTLPRMYLWRGRAEVISVEETMSGVVLRRHRLAVGRHVGLPSQRQGAGVR